MTPEQKSSVKKHEVWAYSISFMVLVIGMVLFFVVLAWSGGDDSAERAKIKVAEQQTKQERVRVCGTIEDVGGKIACLKEARK